MTEYDSVLIQSCHRISDFSTAMWLRSTECLVLGWTVHCSQRKKLNIDSDALKLLQFAPTGQRAVGLSYCEYLRVSTEHSFPCFRYKRKPFIHMFIFNYL